MKIHVFVLMLLKDFQVLICNFKSSNFLFFFLLFLNHKKKKSKWFLSKLGHEGLNQMLDGFSDRTAYALCTFAYFDPESKKPILFEGKTDVIFYLYFNLIHFIENNKSINNRDKLLDQEVLQILGGIQFFNQMDLIKRLFSFSFFLSFFLSLIS